MIDFPAHPFCSGCDLHAQCTSRGLPTRPLSDRPTATPATAAAWSTLPPTPPPHLHRAVLVIGEAPGRDEDAAGMSWVGWAGQILYRWLTETYRLHELADVYLANACRCRPPANDAPKNRHQKACRAHLHDDIRALIAHYGPENVVLLCLGAPAVNTILRVTISAAVSRQGTLAVPFQMAEPAPALPVFSSYHPAAMAPRRKPELVHSFDVHMKQLCAYLNGAAPSDNAMPDPIMAPDTIGAPQIVSLDIETYGILKGYEQTVFHPARSTEVDGVAPVDQIASVSLAWMAPAGMRVAYYDFHRGDHIRAFVHCLASLAPQNGGEPRTTLTGMNIKYDLMYLRHRLPALRLLLVDRHFRLEDLGVLNHLHSDLRPERSLKALATLFNEADYGELVVSTLPTGAKARGSDDPNLILYNCLDTTTSLRLYYRIITELNARPLPILRGFDPVKFRSDLIWLVLHMEEAGLRFDTPALEAIRTRLQRRLDRIALVMTTEGFTLSGTGSGKSKRTILLRGVAECLLLHRHLEFKLTPKTKEVSTDKANVALLLAKLPRSSPTFRIVKCLDRHAKVRGVMDSYVKPLLDKPAIGCISGGRAYPSWYPVPSHQRDESEDYGGTRQARFAAHGPAAQTFPPIIKTAITSRYCPGIVAAYDLRQIELYVAALLSGDPAMIGCFERDEDLHHIAALDIWPDLDPTAKNYKPRRQVGKRTNFLMQYRGGPKRLIEAVFKDCGMELSYSFAESCIERNKRRFIRRWEWQDELIQDATLRGFLVLATGWKRTFIRSASLVESTFVNEICNFPVQTYSAQVMQSAQIEILRRRRAESLTFVMPTNIHDDIVIDAPADSFPAADAMVRSVLAAPPLWSALCDSVGRSLPVRFDPKVLFRSSP